MGAPSLGVAEALGAPEAPADDGLFPAPLPPEPELPPPPRVEAAPPPRIEARLASPPPREEAAPPREDAPPSPQAPAAPPQLELPPPVVIPEFEAPKQPPRTPPVEGRRVSTPSGVIRAPMAPEEQPNMKKVIVMTALTCAILVSIFFALCRRTLSVEGRYRFQTAQPEAVALSFILDDQKVITTGGVDLHLTQSGDVWSYSAEVTYYMWSAPKSVKLRLEAPETSMVDDAVEVPLAEGRTTLPLVTVQSRSRGRI